MKQRTQNLIMSGLILILLSLHWIQNHYIDKLEERVVALETASPPVHPTDDR